MVGGATPSRRWWSSKSTCPEIKVVVCSGYSDQGRRELAAKAAHRGMWTKLISPAGFGDAASGHRSAG